MSDDPYQRGLSGQQPPVVSPAAAQRHRSEEFASARQRAAHAAGKPEMDKKSEVAPPAIDTFAEPDIADSHACSVAAANVDALLCVIDAGFQVSSAFKFR